MAVDVGDEAPDFELPDQDRTPVRLSSFRGSKNVVLVFYPKSFTGVCQGEHETTTAPEPPRASSLRI